MELVRFPSRGGFSVRSIISFALAVVITALLWVVFSGTPAHAADATWNNDTILYDNHGYTKTTELTDTSGTIPDGATVYRTPLQAPTSTSSSQKVFILYFSPGVDPPTATSAKYVEFTYKDGKLSKPTNQKDVVATPRAASPSGQSSCSVTGIGWIICPLSEFMAGAMDWLFGLLASLIAVQPPILGDPNNSMYVAWNITRTIANVAFVIVFLIIIYSQLTSTGISNYGLKRLTPRLIVAAVLVNISFIIAALAIDISNVLGYSVQSIFNTIREQTFHLTNDDIGGFNTNAWGTITAVVLAGGGVIGGFSYISNGGYYLLVPLLLGLIAIAILVVVILAARQAIIILLVIVAPLAFVANLLPNTEKWFEKWKDLFFTMLVFFPAFSLVFGGSQLAGQIIIQNAGDNIVMLIFGLAVQVAPLVITPLILKLSGGLLGKIAQITGGFVNNPNKGPLDRTKKWAEARAEAARWSNIEKGPRLRNPASWGNGLVSSQEFRKRNLQNRIDTAKQGATNRYEQTAKYAKLHERKAGVDMDKDAIHNQHAKHLEDLKVTPTSSLYGRALNVQASKEKFEAAQNVTSAHFNRQRTIAGTALNASSNYLEYSKMSLEASDNEKTVYQTNQKLTHGTLLNGAVDRLETSKLRVEKKNHQYTTMVDKMKVDANTGLYSAAIATQSAKELSEAAQAQIQAHFDKQRRDVGSSLNLSMIELNEQQFNAERSKALTEAYLNVQKEAIGSPLHAAMMKAEQAKFVNEDAQAAVARVIKEYKSGQITDAAMTPELVAIMEAMEATSASLSAQNQGSEAAQYEIQRSIADKMAGRGPLTESLLDIAQGVGGEAARLRARARAVKQQDKLDDEALDINVELLGYEAANNHTTIKKWSKSLIDAFMRGETEFGDEDITDERLKAAMQAQAKEKNMSLFEAMRGDRRFNQDMISSIIARNKTDFKIAGGFHLQEDPSLNIDNFASEAEFQKALAYNRLQSLGNTSASNMSGLKMGWLADLADIRNNGRNLENSINEARADGAEGEMHLRKVYTNVREALQNPQIRATIGDREDEVRAVEARLARLFGTEPTPDDRPRIV